MNIRGGCVEMGFIILNIREKGESVSTPEIVNIGFVAHEHLF